MVQSTYVGQEDAYTFPLQSNVSSGEDPAAGMGGLEPPSCPTPSPWRPLISEADFRNSCSALPGRCRNGCKALLSPALLINAVKAQASLPAKNVRPTFRKIKRQDLTKEAKTKQPSREDRMPGREHAPDLMKTYIFFIYFFLNWRASCLCSRVT